MTTYALRDGMTLVVTEAGGERAVITFHAGDFADIGAATAEEVMAVLERDGIPASMNDDGALQIGKPLPEGRAPVSVETRASTAAKALGLSRDRAAAAAAAPPKAAPADPGLLVHNMTASPIQLVMVTRSVVVPSGGVEALTAAEAAHRPLQRLAESGAVRLTFNATGKP